MSEMYDSVYIRVPVKYKDKYHNLSRLKKRLFMIEASMIITRLIEKYESLTEDDVIRLLQQQDK